MGFRFCSENATTTLVDLADRVNLFSSVRSRPHLSLPAPLSPPEISAQAGVVAPRAEIQLPDLPYALVSVSFSSFFRGVADLIEAR